MSGARTWRWPEQDDRMKNPDSYHHGDLRAVLVEAVRRLVEEKGPDRFSVSDACRMAGVSTAAPYRHFSDKEEMLLAVAQDGIRRQRAGMEASVLGQPPGADETIARLGDAYVAFALREPAVFRLIFGLTRTHSDHAGMIGEGMQTFGVLLNQMAHRTGHLQDAPEVMAASLPLWTFVHGLSFLLIDDKLAAMKLDVDVPSLIRTSLRKLLAG
jgi:AcrR family transcriptional regulator